MPNNTTATKTNATPGSIAEVNHQPITFAVLWKNYPQKAIKHINPSTKKDEFDNHCAINVSDSLYKSGVLLKAFKGSRCWSCPSQDSKGKGIHALKAQDLADYLKLKPFAGCPKALEKNKVASLIRAFGSRTNHRSWQLYLLPVPKPQPFNGGNFEAGVSGKTGIIFFRDYWRRQNQRDRTGDHIDLWNKNELASLGWFPTWLRRTMPELSEDYFDMSDLRQSKEVLFWEMT